LRGNKKARAVNVSFAVDSGVIRAYKIGNKKPQQLPAGVCFFKSKKVILCLIKTTYSATQTIKPLYIVNDSPMAALLQLFF
jgi:hypothetical protein